MYTLVLTVHSWLRWLALVAGVAATVTAVSDRSESWGPDAVKYRTVGDIAQKLRGQPTESEAARTRTTRTDMWGLALMMLLDLQMLTGVLLYLVLSPFTTEAMKDFGAAMRNPGLRFFAVEHLTLMLGAVVLAHVGLVLARKAATPEARRMRLMFCFGFATVLMLLGIPWPGMASGRPLFRI